MTFTKEKLTGIIESADDVLQALAGTHEDIHTDSDKMCEAWNYLNDNAAPPAVVKRLAEIALASLEAEPVAWQWEYRDKNHVTNDPARAKFVAQDGDVAVQPLFTAPPAPVSVPETLPCPVLLEPGMRFGKGVRTQTMLDALQRRAKYYAELEAMTPEQRAEHDAGIKEFAAMLQGANGNYPVIPDGWKLVPVEPTQAMIDAHIEGVQSGGMQKGYRAMLAAAPQQEVKS